MKRQPKTDDQSAGEIRKHYFLDRYVIFAPKRDERPQSFAHTDEPHVQPNPHCPFCQLREPLVAAFPSRREPTVRVVTNAFPALSPDTPKAFGYQEVIIETDNHQEELSDLPLSRLELVFEAYAHRLSHYRDLPGVRYVLIFKNDGARAGASINHAHSQVMALPLIPPQVETETLAMIRYRDEHASCPVCDLTTWEERQRVRIIYADKHVVALAPYASAAPFNAWIVPRRHFGRFTDAGVGERRSMATALKLIISRLDSLGISFNFFLQESIEHEDHHFVFKIEPRGRTPWGGVELGTGVVVNPVLPEYAALWYRGKLK